jgi:hypothetical protein
LERESAFGFLLFYIDDERKSCLPLGMHDFIGFWYNEVAFLPFFFLLSGPTIYFSPRHSACKARVASGLSRPVVILNKTKT